MNQKEKLRKIISDLILEYEETRLDKSLANVNLMIKCTKDTHIPDTLTRIRVLPTVSVVGQKSPVNRDEKGASVEVYVKFLPSTSETYKNLISISELVKGLPGVKTVRVVALGGRKVTYRGKPIVI